MKLIKSKDLKSLTALILSLSSLQLHAIALPDCTSNGSEINGNFDLPVMSSANWQLRNDSLVPAWNGVTGPNIEFWRPTFINPTSPNAGNRLELNSDNDDGYYLNFDSNFVPGRQVSVKFEHAARNRTGNDTVDVFLSEGSGTRSIITSHTSTQVGGPAWSTINSNFIIQNTGYTNMRVIFDPRDTGSSGNLLDGVVIKSTCDYGDAPIGYPSASNSVNNLLFIGSALRPTFESSDQNSAAANLDSGDNGVSSFPSSTATTNYQVNVDVTNSTGSNSTLCGFIDFGQDGDFEADETICTTVTSGATSATLDWPIPLADRNKSGDFVVRLQLTSDVSGANDGEVEDYIVPISTLPITLSSVKSQLLDGDINIQWTTATETNNAGYYLEYWNDQTSRWSQLNDKLIPSKVINSHTPQVYHYRAKNHSFNEFRIIDVNIHGIKKDHGAFKTGKKEGVNAVENIKPINWKNINSLNKISLKNKSNLKSFHVLNHALLSVEFSGIQKFSYNDLITAGALIDNLKIENLAITDDSVSITRHVNDNNQNGLFDAGDSIDFLGINSPTLYSSKNTYLLSDNQQKVSESTTLNTNNTNAENIINMTRLNFENQREYSYAGRVEDPWFDQLLFANGSAAILTKEFDLIGLQDGDSQLELKVWGLTDFTGETNDHHIKIYVNSTLIYDYWYDGNSDASNEFTIPSGILNQYNNTFTLEVPGDTAYPFDIQAFDSFNITYPKLSVMNSDGKWSGLATNNKPFKVTDAIGTTIAWRMNSSINNPDVLFSDTFEINPNRIMGNNTTELKGEGHWYIADSRAWHKPEINPNIPDTLDSNDSVDYLIVAHPLFLDSTPMNSLISLQQARGYSTKVVNVESIYAEYSDYAISPQAIKIYVKKISPKFLLLVGADSFDYHDYLQLDSQSFIPTFYRNNGVISFTPADSAYSEFNDDGIMQLAIGRLPVRTINDFEQVVNKLTMDQVHSSIVLVSGPSEDGSRYETTTLDNMAYLPESVGYSTISSDKLGSTDAYLELSNQLNSTSKLVSYLGHSSYSIWGLNRTDAVLDSDVVTGLNNITPHKILQWACWNTYFVNPEISTMAELFLIQNNGASNVFGATALTDLKLINHYNRELFSLMDQNLTLGELIMHSSNQVLMQNPLTKNAILGFALLGDPASPMQ